MGDHHLLKHDVERQVPNVLTASHARPDELDADQAAVSATNSGAVTWKDAHEAWLARTHRELSPGAFGRHILALGGGKNPKAPEIQRMPLTTATQSPSLQTTSHPPRIQQQLPTTSALNTPTLPPDSVLESQTTQAPKQGISRPVHTIPQEQARPTPSTNHGQSSNAPKSASIEAVTVHGDQDSLAKQREDITRIDGAIRHLHTTLTTVANQVNSLRQEIRGRPGPVLDDASLDILTQNLSNVMNKTAEIDSLKMQLSVLQRRMKRFEDAPGSAISSTQAEMATGTQRSSLGTYTASGTPLTQSVTTDAATSSNALKRALSESSQSEAKRLKHGDEGEVHAREPSIQTPGVAISASPYFITHQGSPDLWQSAIQPLNVFPPLSSGKRGPGRPRKHPASHQLTPTQTPHLSGWTQTPANEMPWDVDYSYIGGADSVDRGLVVRRGGGSLSGSVISPDGRRIRSRPIRNEQGVLIRKDGKPDKRSQTSAENLRRIMSRRAEAVAQGLNGSQSRHGSAQLDGASDQGRAQDAFNGQTASALVVLDGDSEIGGGMDEDSELDEESVDSMSPAPVGEDAGTAIAIKLANTQGGITAGDDELKAVWQRQHSQAQQSLQTNAVSTTTSTTSTHPEIMKKMFPHGRSEEQRRMDFSSQLFRTNTPSETVREKPVARMTQRAEAGINGDESAPAAQVAGERQAVPPQEVVESIKVDKEQMGAAPEVGMVIDVDGDEDNEDEVDISP